MKIAHLADIQIRFGSRHHEYRTVFDRLYEDLEKNKPDRIVVAGDLNHHKINISPSSLILASEFLIKLSRIAPTDVILGNHDINLQQLDQGDSISPIFKIVELIQNSDEQCAFVVTKDNKSYVDFQKKAVYLYPDSGFYNIGKNVVYGVFSIKDNEILFLENKEPGVKYIALYHGTVYGARGDNGYEQRGDNLMRLSTFKNFDIGILGDIHEYQTFREDESIAYCGSLIQQNYGESIDKGYLLWDTDTNSHVRKFIPNDYGFAKIVISKGEDVDERINHIRFSHNKKKTKVHIILEEYEENFSQERENQIAKQIKEKHGCEIVKVEHSFITKEILVDDEQSEDPRKQSEEYIIEFIKNGSFDCSEDELKDILKLHSQINQELGINEHLDKVNSTWHIDSVEISNIFSFPIKPTTIDFNELTGITGLFGENYNGKSNVIKAIVWGLYKEVLGGGDPKFIVNIYTDSNQGYVKIYLTIDGKKYMIHRTIKTTKHKDGKVSNSYGIQYKSLEFEYDEDGNIENEKWEDEKSDEKTAEKKEVEALVENAIGDFDDFTKVSLQVQGGKDDYINQSQQPKNALISRYLGLEPYKMRYEYANEYFKEIKKKQKEIGDKLNIELRITELTKNKDEKNLMITKLKSEKDDVNTKKEELESKILDLTKKIEKLEPVQYSDPNLINSMIESEEANIVKYNKAISDLETWLSENFKKELPFSEGETLDGVTKDLETQQSLFKQEKEEYLKIDSWLKENSKKELPNIDGIEDEIYTLKEEILTLQNQLTTYRGKSCPTCGHVQQKADPDKEKECLNKIAEKNSIVTQKQAIIVNHKAVEKFNNDVDKKLSKLQVLVDSLKNRKDRIELLKKKIELFANSKDIIEHNAKVEENTNRLNKGKDVKTQTEKKIESLKENLSKVISNSEKQKKNRVIQEQIDEANELLKAYKLTFHNIEKNITTLYGDVRVIESEINNLSEKLESIKEAERLFKKYSVYLQAMHRDGIPALIIRKKLPIINSKINSILQNVVNFKVELEISAGGDISEYFYYSDDKSDALPLQFASGAQKFVASIAIKDSLHFISQITKPSMCIIDEGFGTLDTKLSFEIVNILQYLKNKYKNVILITHKNEIKDFADNIIEVTKVKTGIPQHILDINPEAGTTKLQIS